MIWKQYFICPNKFHFRNIGLLKWKDICMPNQNILNISGSNCDSKTTQLTRFELEFFLLISYFRINRFWFLSSFWLWWLYIGNFWSGDIGRVPICSGEINGFNIWLKENEPSEFNATYLHRDSRGKKSFCDILDRGTGNGGLKEKHKGMRPICFLRQHR